MKLSIVLSFSALVAAASANPVDPELAADNHAHLVPRGGSATGCVQAHCTTIQETTLTSKSIIYEIYWNAQKIFTLTGKPESNLQWNGQRDFKGRQWGFKSVGDCQSLAYINDFQSTYDYYELTRTSRASNKHDCPPCTQKGNKDKCATCTDYEAIFSDGNSGQCYGYHGLPTCDFKGVC